MTLSVTRINKAELREDDITSSPHHHSDHHSGDDGDNIPTPATIIYSTFSNRK